MTVPEREQVFYLFPITVKPKFDEGFECGWFKS